MNKGTLNLNNFVDLEAIKENAIKELREKDKKRVTCKFISTKALEEMKERCTKRPYSRLFYELAFSFRESTCLSITYQIWRPVMRSWIIIWDSMLESENYSDVVDELIYDTFDVIFLAVLQNRFLDFEAGKVHNYLKNTLHYKVVNRYRNTKRFIISKLKERRNNLTENDLKILKDKILIKFKATRSYLEVRLFEMYLLENISIKEISDNEEIISELGEAANIFKKIHNRIQTVVWNVFKLLKKEIGNSSDIKELLSVWAGDF